MPDYYLAIDIGASSGRHILGYINNNKLFVEEVYRFENSTIRYDNSLLWDTNTLFKEIINGLKICKQKNMIPISMGIDTWAVDYVLLDKNYSVLGKTYAYRDSRTSNMDKEVYKIISESELYQKTGIQKQSFNTIYQLMATKILEPNILHQSKSFLMIPDYFHFLLTGIKTQEYTNASTTQLVNVTTNNWDKDLINKLGFDESLFNDVTLPGTYIGNLRKEIQDEIGFDCKIVVPATHDTGSAVMSVPSTEKDILYISSGTWSLMGTELDSANTTSESQKLNFTNEGGYNFKFRYLKNIMGLWMIQSIKKEFNNEYSFSQLCQLAENATIKTIIDCNDNRFLSPKSMVTEIQQYCKENDLEVPKTVSEISAVIYNSLAKCYSNTKNEIEKMTNINFNKINIVGGGSKADYLNLLTEKYSNTKVEAGPSEATAIGNIICQMIENKVFKTLIEARGFIKQSNL